MDIQDKIERYLQNQMTESEKTDFEIDMHTNTKLKQQVEIETEIVTQIRNQAFVDAQIKTANEELNREKFERFLTDGMNKSEKADFENELKDDPLLKEQFDLEAKIVDQIKDSSFVDSQINTAQNEIKKGRSIRMRYYTIVSVAAVFIMILVMPFMYRNLRYNNLYKENYTNIIALHGNETLRGVSPEKRFINAISKMEEGNIQNSQKILEGLLEQPKGFIYYEETRWYLALVHLKLHDKSEVKSYLQEVIDLNEKYKKQAVDLIDKL